MRSVFRLPAGSGQIDDVLRAGPDLLLLAGGGDPDPVLRKVRARAPGLPVFVAVGPSDEADALAAAMVAAPEGIWLHEAVGRADIERLANRLAVLEAEIGLPDRSTRVVAAVGSARGALALPSLAEAGPRLAGIAYEPAAVARDLGCEDSDGAGPLAWVRAAVVVTAAAAGVPAIECAAGGEMDAYAGEAARARRDGFSAKLAATAEQVACLRRAAAQAPLGRWMENFVSGVATK